jgi:molybdate transport system substrate-binding protein
MLKSLFFISLISAILLPAQTIQIAAASDLKFCLDELIREYSARNTNKKISVTYGSSGKFFTQIQQGAPFDIYFSADIEYPKKLYEAGLTTAEPVLYAIGRLVLWSSAEDASKLTLQDLKASRFTKIAIANPDHAPYGKGAQEAIVKSRIYEDIKHRLVYGDNISQTAQFVQSGSVPIGIIALSLVNNPAFIKQPYYLIPSKHHTPLEQAFVLLKKSETYPLVLDFVHFLSTPHAKSIFTKYGFLLPQGANAK